LSNIYAKTSFTGQKFPHHKTFTITSNRNVK
jgi:hypothetical protein